MVVRSVVVTLVGVGNDTVGSVVPVLVTFTAADPAPEAGHDSAVEVVVAGDAVGAAEDVAGFGAAVAQPARRATPLRATRAGRSRRGRCTGASWAIGTERRRPAPKFLDCRGDHSAAHEPH